jgi:hypothetical protein
MIERGGESLAAKRLARHRVPFGRGREQIHEAGGRGMNGITRVRRTKSGSSDAQAEPGGRHVHDKPIRGVRFERQRHVNVGAESGHAVEDDGLGAEHVPAALKARDRRERDQQLKCGGLDRHGGTTRRA